ncbi:hypothetical protein BRARA_B02581 [Brassica rapa]|uniref:Uncharacterized protein n=1 Tax=Brassica campestris TaxID=3711 RepID=A0A398ACI5_BRACM|nr:hypothetical protein BRARA_B02581 [Brassica rapa]
MVQIDTPDRTTILLRRTRDTTNGKLEISLDRLGKPLLPPAPLAVFVTAGDSIETKQILNKHNYFLFPVFWWFTICII